MSIWKCECGALTGGSVGQPQCAKCGSINVQHFLAHAAPPPCSECARLRERIATLEQNWSDINGGTWHNTLKENEKLGYPEPGRIIMPENPKSATPKADPAAENTLRAHDEGYEAGRKAGLGARARLQEENERLKTDLATMTKSRDSYLAISGKWMERFQRIEADLAIAQAERHSYDDLLCALAVEVGAEHYGEILELVRAATRKEQGR